MPSAPANISGINLDKVYEVVTIHLPQLIENISPLISSLEAEAEWEDD